jgi:outer membrane cobalamin receptor
MSESGFFVGELMKKMVWKLLIQWIALVLFYSYAGLGYGQDAATEEFRGVLLTGNKKPVAEARIALTPGKQETASALDGSFRFTGLTPGRYLLMVSSPGQGLADIHREITIPSVPLTLVMDELLYQSGEVVVIAGTIENKTDDRPSFVTVRDRSEFERTASSVADVVADTPGAIVTSTGGLGSYTEVSLRGAFPNQVQVFLDGMLLNDSAGGSVNLGTILLAPVDRIEVWRSGAPAMLGGEAIGGAVNIHTRDLADTYTTGSVGFGSFKTFQTSAVVAGPQGLSRWLVGIDHASSDNDYEYLSDNGTALNPDDDYTSRRKNDQYRNTGALVKYRRLIDASLLEITDQFTDTRKNIPSLQHIGVSNASIDGFRNVFQIRASHSPGWFSPLEFTPVFQTMFNREQYRDPDNQIGWGVQDNRYDTFVAVFQTPSKVSLGSFGQLVFTPLFRRETYRPRHSLEAADPLACERIQLAFAGDATYTPFENRLTLTGSLRRDRYASDFEGQPSPANPVTPEPVTHSHTGSQAGASLSITQWCSLKTNYGDTWREPGFFELFGDRGMTVSNPNLKPERVFRRDGGIMLRTTGDGNLFKGSFECARFDNLYRNIIQWYIATAGFTEPANVGGAWIRGTELIWRGTVVNHLTCTGSWTLQDSKVTESTRSYHEGKKLPNHPERYGVVTLEGTFKSVTAYWLVDHKGSFYLDRANQAHRRYPGRTLHNIGITVPIPSLPATCTLTVRNITDECTFDMQGMPKPGRSYFVTLTYRPSEQ